MFCTNCGKILTEPRTVCPYCGARIENADEGKPQTSDLPDVSSYTEPKAPKESGKPRRSRVLLFGTLGALFATAALIFALVAGSYLLKAPLQYRKAVTLLEAQDYEGAQTIFLSLGDYADSRAMSETTSRWIRYREALDLMDRGEYRAARDAFRSDPDFEDAAACIEECDRALSLEDARSLMEAGQYQEALDLLETARGIEKADTLILSCRRTLAEQEYAALVGQGAYAEALDLLRSEDGALLENRDARIGECEKRITYRAAEEALNEGRRSDAYKLFLALGDWSDAQSRITECLAERPETGELFHDDAYSEGNLVLTVRPPSDGTDTFFRIFSIVKDQPIRVVDLFIRSGDVVSTKLPEGTYLFKSAYGFEWFGEPDLFGDSGVYQRLRSSETSDLFALEKGFAYTLVLRSEDEGNVDAVDEDPGDF